MSNPVRPGYALPAITASPSLAAGAIRSAEIAANPSSYYLPIKPRSVVNQGDLPCCVSTALGAAMEAMNPGWPQLAPLFHYYVTRYDNKGADTQGFLFLDRGLSTLTSEGICKKELHARPYTTEGASSKPSPAAYADAVTRALGRRNLRLRYSASEGPSIVVWIREQLRRNCPVVLGIQLPRDYPEKFLNPLGEWRDPDVPRTRTGHCVLALGYDDSRQALRIQDSRGSTEFDQGCWWLGYRVVDSTVVQEVYKLIP